MWYLIRIGVFGYSMALLTMYKKDDGTWLFSVVSFGKDE